MAKYSIEFYTKENGEKPAKDFLLSADNKLRAKLSRLLFILEENGNDMGETYIAYVEDGIFELHGKSRSNISRILYFFFVGNRIVLTNGFLKKSRKTPEKEIALAKKYKENHLEGSQKMSKFEDFLNEQMQDPEFRREYENLEPEFDIIRAMVEARKTQGLTQKDISQRTGINQADISRIENGTRNPSLDMLKRLANGLGMRLKLEFIPKEQN